MNVLKKKKDADEEKRLKAALEEFRETFEDGSCKHIPKTFIRGDIVNADKSVVVTPAIYKPSPIGNLGTAAAQPAAINFSVENALKRAKETADKIMQQAARQASANSAMPLPLAVTSPATKSDAKKSAQSTKMSNLEMFKEELKQIQEMREGRKGLRQQLKEKFGEDNEAIDRIAPPLDNPYLGVGGEFDDDLTTTNLYVCNLPLGTQMEDLYETFGSYGPLASAKILHPKPDDERRAVRQHLCGFIAYMSRTDAARAMHALAGERLRDSKLRVSWARPVTIPPVPFYMPIALRELAMPDPPSGLPFNAKPLSPDLRYFLRKYHNLPRLGAPFPDDPQLIADYKQMISNSVVRVVIPTERPLLALIHRVIEFLVREGPVFEAILMAKERANPLYRFLFENHHPTHVYYRWKLYSILQGDDRTKWRLERFRMFENGSWWEPPPHSLFEDGMPPQLYDTAYVSEGRAPRTTLNDDGRSRKRTHSRQSADSDGNSDNDDDGVRRPREGGRQRSPSDVKKWRGVPSDDERRELDDLLRNILPDKTSIGDAMVWCLDHADCAKEIIQSISDSICGKEEQLHKTIARVYLCSDILANCGARVRDVFYFRQYLGDNLVKIFVSLSGKLEAIQSRIKAEQFRQRIMMCFRMWEDNSIYPTDTLINLQNIFLGLSKPMDESVLDDVDGEPMSTDDIDGMPLDADDIDGVPLDESVNSPPPIINKFSAKKQTAIENDSLFKTSSWSQVTEDKPSGETSSGVGFSSKWDNLEDAPNTKSTGDVRGAASIFTDSPERESSLRRPKFNDEEASDDNGEADDSQGSLISKEYEEERRKMLRDIEVKVVKLQDDLESDRQNKNIDEELAQYRKKLMEKMEEKLTKLHSKRSAKPSGSLLSSSSSKREKSPKNSRVSKKERNEDTSESSRYERARERDRDRDRGRDLSRDRSRSRDRNTSSRHDRDHVRDRERDDRDRRRERSDGRRRR